MKNILMNVKMTKAILDGRKVQTRRVVKTDEKFYYKTDSETRSVHHVQRYIERFVKENAKYQIGETIWVREPAKIVDFDYEFGDTWAEFLTDGKVVKFELDDRFQNVNGLELPKWITKKQGIPNGCITEMARIFLKITDVRVERLQGINEDDCISEGIEVEEKSGEWYRDYLENYHNFNIKYPKESFESLWNSTAPKGYKWKDNPYVFVYDFERVER